MNSNSDTSYTSSAIEELVLGLAAASGRTHLIILGRSINPGSFRRKFQQVTCVLALDAVDPIDHHQIHELANNNTIVLCLNYDGLPANVSQTIVDCCNRDAIVVRISEPSDELYNSFLRGEFLRTFELQVEAKPIFLSLLMPVNALAASRAVAIYDREVECAVRQVLIEEATCEKGKKGPTENRPPLAVMSCYNEKDIIEQVVLDYRREGCELLVLDNWSTDTTWEILERLQELDPSGIKIKRFPDVAPSAASWRAILAQKEEVALQHPGRWILHVDADELRRGPFEGLTLAEALRVAQICGANRIDFNVLNFRPVHGGEWSGSLEQAFSFFQFPDHLSYFVQKKAWIQGYERVNLADSGGHEASFGRARDFQYKYLVKHYPLRSVPQGRNKLHRYRRSRWETSELDAGWHAHNQSIASRYASLIWPVEELEEFNPNTFREEYGLVVATTLAYFLSLGANGPRVDPQYWSDPDQGRQLATTLEETRNLLGTLITETQSSMASLRMEMQSSMASIRTEMQSALASLRSEAQSTMRSGYRQQVAGRRSKIWTRLFDRIRSERAILSKSGLVDAEWYRRSYPDVVESPVDHYLRVGAMEGRDPNPLFSTKAYLKLNPDVAASGLNPLVHFVRCGAAEGRSFSE